MAWQKSLAWLLAYCCFSLLILSSTSYSKQLPNDEWIKEVQPKQRSLLTENQHFKFNIGSEPETLDPGIITGLVEMKVVIGLFEGLLSYHPKTLEPVPGIAYKYDLDNTGKIYTFHLRKGAKWSNGTALTAIDFYRSWKRVLTPKTGASYASQLYPIQGAEKYHKAKLKDFNKVGVKVIDQHTLEVTLHAPCPYFTDLCAFVTLFPTPVALIEKYGDAWVKPENIITNGPFTVKDWTARSIISMEPNPQYWDKENVHLKKVSAYLYDDIDTSYKLFLSGDLDWIESIPASKSRETIWNPEYFAMSVLGSYFYRFNVTKPPLDDVRVRKALSMSIDRTVITRQILKGGEQPANFYCPPVAGYQHVEGLPYDIEQAKQYLKEAGYGDGGQKFPKLELLYNTQEVHKKIAEMITESWREALGVEVKLRNTEWKVFLSEIDQLNYDI